MYNFKGSKNVIVRVLFLLLVFLSISQAKAQVTPTTGTGTNVSTSGGVITVTTTDRFNNFAVNTFDNFQVNTAGANRVDFVFPVNASLQQIRLLVNRVFGSNPVDIDTTINGVVGGTNGAGTMIFVSSNGINIGPNANINVGALLLSTTSNMPFTGIDSNTYHFMDPSPAAFGPSGGIDPSSVITIERAPLGGSNANLITNAGVINASGLETFEGQAAHVAITGEAIDNNGIIRIHDGISPVEGGDISLAVANEVNYYPTLGGAFTERLIPVSPIASFETIVNAGEITNSGTIEACAGKIELLASSYDFAPTGRSYIENSGTIRSDAISPDMAAGDIRLITFENNAGSNNNEIVHNGTISARSTLDEMSASLPAFIELGSDNIITGAGAVLDVTGADFTSRSGMIIARTAPDAGGNTEIAVGNNFSPMPGVSVINNDFFESIADTDSATPPIVSINTPGSIYVEELNITKRGIKVELETSVDTTLTPTGSIQTNSSIAIHSGTSISLFSDIDANFDNYGNYNKGIALNAPSIFFDNAGNSNITIQSDGVKSYLEMTSDQLSFFDQNTFTNYDINTLEGGTFIYKPSTNSYNVNMTGIRIQANAINQVFFNNLDFGSYGAGLIIGDPKDGTYEGLINVTAPPSSAAFDFGFVALMTENNTANTPITISNCDFDTRNITVIGQAKSSNAAVGIEAILNNNFRDVSFTTSTSSSINLYDANNGINFAPVPLAMINTDIIASEINFETPVGINGTIYMDIAQGNLNLFNVDAGTAPVDIYVNNGSIDLLYGYTLSGSYITLFADSAAGSNITLDGSISSSDGRISIISQSPSGIIDIGSDSLLRTTGTEAFTGIEIQSNNQLIIRGDLFANYDTTIAGQKDIYIASPVVFFDNTGGNTPEIRAISTAGPDILPVILKTDSINISLPVTQPLITSLNSAGQNGIFVIDRFNPGDIVVNATGIDINGGGNDLLFESDINLGTRYAELYIGNPDTFINSTERIVMTGVPTNSAGSFIDGTFGLNAATSGPAGNAIIIGDCNFATNNQNVSLKAVNAPTGFVAIDASSNNTFHNLSIETTGIADIISVNNTLNVDVIPSYFWNFIDMEHLIARTANNNDIIINGMVSNLAAIAGGSGNIIFTPHDSTNLLDINANTGIVDVYGIGNVNVLASSNIFGREILLRTDVSGSGNIIIDGTLASNNGRVLIEQNSPSNDVIIGSTGHLSASGAATEIVVEIESARRIIHGGTIEVAVDTSQSAIHAIELFAPIIEFDNTANPVIRGLATAGPEPVVVIVETDNIINGTYNFASPVIFSSFTDTGDRGAFYIDRYTPGNVTVNATGIDINGGGNDLSFANINLGSSGGHMFVGDPEGSCNIRRIDINGKPSNTYGSFDQAMFMFTSALNSSAAHGIIVQNSNFVDSHPVFKAPFVTGSYGINATNNVNFSEISLNTEGTAIITDTAGGISVIDYFFDSVNNPSRVANLNITTASGSNGNISGGGDFDSLTFVSDGTGNIDFHDIQNGVILRNIDAQTGSVNISSAGDIWLQNGRTVQGARVTLRNVANPDTGEVYGNIEIMGNLISRSGNVNILTARGNVIIDGGMVEANAGTSSTGGNVNIRRSNSLNTLYLTMLNSGSIHANGPTGAATGIVSVGDSTYTGRVEVTGNDAGNLSANSPYTSSRRINAPTGNILADRIDVILEGSLLPPVDDDSSDGDDGSSDDNDGTTDNNTDINTDDIAEEVGDDILITESNIITLNASADNTLLNDLSDDSTYSTTSSTSEENFDIQYSDGFSSDTEGFTNDDSIDFTLDSSDDNTNNSSDSSGTGEDGSNEDTGIEDGDETAEEMDDTDEQNSAMSGNMILAALEESDDTIDTGNPDVMGIVFNLCKGANSCQDIDTPENKMITDQAININSQEAELEADKYGTEYLVYTGYHPRALEGFLMTLQKVEKLQKQGINEFGQNVTPVFSYRHPKTSDRIQLIEHRLKEEKVLLTIKQKRINKKDYLNILDDIK